MEESERMLLIQFPLKKIFSQELYTTLIDNFYSTDPDELTYQINININGLVDKNKLIKKIEEKIDKKYRK